MLADDIGTAHADELIYLWDFDMSLKLEGQDLKFSKFLVKLWVNFITYGKPTPEGFKFNWPQWDDVKQKYIKFSNRGIFQEEKLLAGRTQFWSSIMEK
ncbi:hypothetical protein O3M35_010595 [Rhynocoris fuscipes]|uniref:Carboxylesterase type B domain-containing protein n=1 Tax=Rhynocoris fuscipes TaxID=488301 RepID=A0AAW1D0H6_9HEMI